MRKFLFENVVFVMISIAAFVSEPVLAQTTTTPYAPINFTEPLKLSRGNLTPISPGGVYLDRDDRCRLVVDEFGWDNCIGLDALVFALVPEIDNLVVLEPTDDGHVKFDDWDSEDRDAEIADIWEGLEAGLKAQGDKLGVTIRALGWAAYPTLNKEKSYMYYANHIEWDGEKQTNIKATLFDRYGYTTIFFVPVAEELTEAEIGALVALTMDAYRANPGVSYVDFQDGDKVAAVGAVGVLATLLGVKYGKGIFATITAIALLVLKKAWFLLFLPLYYLRRIFSRKSSNE